MFDDSLFLTFEQQVKKSLDRKPRLDLRAYKGSDTEKPTEPAFQGSQYKFGDETKSKTYKSGNDVITQFNPTGNEKQTYNYLQDQLPSMYKQATTPQDFTDFTNKYTQNQKDAVNRDYQDSLRMTKNAFVNSGQMGSSIALDKLKPLSDSYLQSMQNIEANAPLYSNQLRNNDLAYNSSVLENAVNGLNQFYNTGNQFNSNATGLSQFGNNVAQQGYQTTMSGYNAKLAADAAKQAAMYKAIGDIGGAATTAAMASDIKTKKNINKIATKNGINIYEFEYKTDEYPELPEGKQVGVIAQEIEKIIPDAVIETDKYKIVDYSKVNKYLN